MKKLVLLLLITTAFTFGVRGQSSTAADGTSTSGDPKNTQVSSVQVTTDASGQVIDGTSADGQKTVAGPKVVTGEKKGCFRISSLSMASGMNKYREIGAGDQDWDKPQIGQHSWSSGDMGSMMGGSQGDILTKNKIILELGLNPWSKKLGDYNKKRELTIALFYSGSNLQDRFREEFTSTPGDTFSFNSVMYQTDTVARTVNSYMVKANVLGAGVQYLFKSDQEKRFSVFAGVGVDAAYALTARIYERYTKDSAVVLSFNGVKEDEIGFSEFDKGNFLGSEGTKTSINAKPTMFASVYVPFGIDFKLCKKKDIWNQFRLFLKGNVGLETAIVVGSKTHFNPYMGMSMGLKFDFK